MTKKEVSEMLNFAIACYPTAQIKDVKKTLEVWSDLFASVSNEQAMNAMKKACQTSKYFPSVAEVMAGVREDQDFWRGKL